MFLLAKGKREPLAIVGTERGFECKRSMNLLRLLNSALKNLKRNTSEQKSLTLRPWCLKRYGRRHRIFMSERRIRKANWDSFFVRMERATFLFVVKLAPAASQIFLYYQK